jgi:hypothetical protein
MALIQCSACHQRAALDADAGMKGVVPGQPGQGVPVRGQEGLERLRLAEDGTPLRSSRTELGLRREGQVELEPAGQQEHPDDAPSHGKVPVMLRAELGVEPPGPPVQHRGELALDGQHQVDVRPAVTVAGGVRAGEGGAGDGAVGFGVREQLLPDAIPLFSREHDPAPRSHLRRRRRTRISLAAGASRHVVTSCRL